MPYASFAPARDMGIATVALYSSTERDSLHVRLADECMPILSEKRYGDVQEVLAIAQQTGADAIYPGYGFLAEESECIQRCNQAGVTFIGPPVEAVQALQGQARDDVEGRGDGLSDARSLAGIGYRG